MWALWWDSCWKWQRNQLPSQVYISTHFSLTCNQWRRTLTANLIQNISYWIMKNLKILLQPIFYWFQCDYVIAYMLLIFLLKKYYAIFPSKTEMIRNRIVWNHLASSEHMFQLPSPYLQLDNQRHSGAANLDMKCLEQGFHCPQDGPNQDLLIVDF